MECFFYAWMIFALCIAASECGQGFYPNVPLPHPTEIPEFTQPDNLFVYNWPMEDQTLCPGTVTALDYCYQKTAHTSGQENRIIFTLLLLDSSYGIIQTINVNNNTTPGNCPDRGGVTTCCNRQWLTPEQQFRVPDSSVTGFGIFSQTGVDTILAFQNSSTVRSVSGFQLAAHAVIANNRISVPQNGELIQYRMFNFAIDNSPVTPDLAGAGGIDSLIITEPTRSTESATRISDNNSKTKNSPDMTSEPLPGTPDPSPTEGPRLPVSITLIIEIVVGCIVVMLFTATVAMWIYLCFKARAIRQRKSKTGINVVTAESRRNSQMIYETIPEDTDVNVSGPMVPPHCVMLVQCPRDEQKEQRILITPNITYNTAEASEFVRNPAYGGLNLLHTGQLETAVTMESNPSYSSSQERLFSN